MKTLSHTRPRATAINRIMQRSDESPAIQTVPHFTHPLGAHLPVRNIMLAPKEIVPMMMAPRPQRYWNGITTKKNSQELAMIPKVATTSKSTSLPQVPVIPTKNSVNIAVHPNQVPTVTDDMENAVFTVGTEHMKGRMASKRIYPGLKTGTSTTRTLNYDN